MSRVALIALIALSAVALGGCGTETYGANSSSTTPPKYTCTTWTADANHQYPGGGCWGPNTLSVGTATGQPFGVTQTNGGATGPIPIQTPTPTNSPTGRPTVTSLVPFLVKTTKGQIIQIVSVQGGTAPLSVAKDGTKPKNGRFVTVYVNVTASDRITDRSAPPAAISPEDFFLVDTSGKRYDVWDGNSLHAVPEPEDRLQATKLPNPQDQATGNIAFDIPEGQLILGYKTPDGALSAAVSRPVFGYWTLPFSS
jgi:hypothetical protein